MTTRKPIRMCIVCKDRGFQNSLIRLQHIDENVVFFSGRKRSFYLCKDCLCDDKKRVGLSKRFKTEIQVFDNLLKEIDG